MKRQFSACQTPRSMYPSIFNSFLVIRTASAKNRKSQKIAKNRKKSFSRTAAHIFVSPGDAPAIITQYVAWIERQFNACRQTPRSMYGTHLSSTVSQLFKAQVQKIAVFTYSSPHFLSPGDAPTTIMQYVAWIERQFNACQTPRSMYLSILNSFRVIRCLIQCVTPKIDTFLFPLGTPLAQSR